jgi:hypothetical protein
MKMLNKEMFLLNVIGWVFIPYIMVYVTWKKTTKAVKFGVFFLAIAVLLIEAMIGSGIAHNPNIGLISLIYIPVQLVLYLIFSMISANTELADDFKEKLESGRAVDSLNVTHLKGLSIGESDCKLSLHKEYLEIESLFSNKSFQIPLHRIFQFDADDVTVSKRKSAIGRAIIGEMIAGPTGAMVGALSARGTKEIKVKMQKYINVGFLNANENEQHVHFKAIGFEFMIVSFTKTAIDLIDRQHANQPETELTLVHL